MEDDRGKRSLRRNVKTFTRKLIHPVTQEIVEADVSYVMEGIFFAQYAEILHVIVASTDIRSLVGDPELRAMEEEARTHHNDTRDASRTEPESP